MNSVTCRTNLPVMLITISFCAFTSPLTQSKVTLFKICDNLTVDLLPLKFIVSAGCQDKRSAGVALRGECKQRSTQTQILSNLRYYHKLGSTLSLICRICTSHYACIIDIFTLSTALAIIKIPQQECIPVGCVPAAH